MTSPLTSPGAGAGSSSARPGRLRNLSFLHMVPTVSTAPREAHAHALTLFELGERLGYDSGWVFTRHLQRGLSSPVAFLAAASQRTSRIGLGAAVIPLEYERLLTLAEGLSTADVLSDGRVEVGVSTHRPKFADTDNDAVFGPGWRSEDYSYERIARLRSLIETGGILQDEPATGPGELWSGRVEPVDPPLARRLWQGGGSLRSVQWAGDNDFDLLLSNVATSIDGRPEFWGNQRRLIESYRERASAGARVKVGLVVVPTDDTTPGQRERYSDYLRAREDRPNSVRADGVILAPDLHGSAQRIVDALGDHLDTVEADEFMVILPFSFEAEDYAQILAVVSSSIAPRLR